MQPALQLVYSVSSRVLSDKQSTSAVVILFALGAFASYRSLRRPTKTPFWGDDLARLGVTRDVKYPGTAVICGGSVSGMLTARVCVDHFEKVVLVDTPGQMGTRSYRSEHPHGYLLFMINVLTRLWSSFSKEAEESGGLRTPADFQIHHGGLKIPAPHQAFPSGKVPETIMFRRKGLDALLQRLLLGHQKNIKRYAGTVLRLNPSEETRRRLSSVLVRNSEGLEEIIEDATLIVDCTGSLQSGLKWLSESGYNIPDNLRITYDPHVRYFTTTFTVPNELKSKLPFPNGYSATGVIYGFSTDAAYGNTGFLMTRKDNDTVMICCFGWGKFDVPKTVDDVIPHVQSVKGRREVPTWVVESLELLIQEGEPVCKSLRLPLCSLIRYDTATDLPSNFVALGDAYMHVNPAFAQGCSIASIEVTALNALLDKSHGRRSPYLPDNFSHSVFKRLAEYMQPTWEANKAIDYGFSSTTPLPGETHKTGGFIRWYMNQAMLAAVDNLNVSTTMFKVQMFLAPATDLMSPSIVWSICCASLKRYLQPRGV